MHCFIGGAHNGKYRYVVNHLKENAVVFSEINGAFPIPTADAPQVLLIRNLDIWLLTQDLRDEVELVSRLIHQLTELAKHHELYIIVTDMGRGVVPMAKEQRLLRDVCGRFYQQLFACSTTVTRIWYGIAQPLKYD